MPKLTLDDCVFLCMRNGEWWTFWDLQKVIKEKSDVFYGEPSISAAIRNLRKEPARVKYKLAEFGEVIEKRKKLNGKGFEYKLIGVKNG
tara:strand:- start:1720 stop:1986 length:267 start_codon:yes stop_codon:yes gene_type:complete